ncbi:MAG: hypothetical protein QXT86_10410 [Archaeoglobaceae archaeon]
MKLEDIEQVKKYYTEFTIVWQDIKYTHPAPHRLITEFLEYVKEEFSFPVSVYDNLETTFLNTVWNFIARYKKVGLRFIEYFLKYHADGIKKGN